MVDFRARTQRKVGIPTVQIKYIAKKVGVKYNEVLARIQRLLNYVWDNVEFDIKQWIDTKVPKRTGNLREGLKQAFEQSYIKNGILRFTLGVLGFAKGYADEVDAMSDAMVRHSGQVGYVYYPNVWNIRGKVILNDPHAVGGFWELIINYMKDRIMRHIAIGKDIYFGSPGKINVKLRRVIV